jgi:hypothetical protein
MKAMTPPSWLSFCRTACRRNIQSILQMDWPVLAGFLAVTCGLLILIASWHIRRTTTHVGKSPLPTVSNQVKYVPASGTAPLFDGFTLNLPSHSVYLADIGRLFLLAKEKSVTIGTIEYRTETNTALPILIHTLDLRVDEAYPTVKAFLAELLRSMPHVFLQEIHIEHGVVTSDKEHVMLKLSFVYLITETDFKTSSIEPSTQNSRAITTDRMMRP